MVAPDVFEMFDNDFHNQTNPLSASSRLIDITINETSKVAFASWSWAAPKDYWTPYWGEVDRLPNGDRLGTFGSQTHSIFWNNLTQSTGAVLVEINPKGDVVRTYTFPESWGIYRAIKLETNENQNTNLTDFAIGIAIVVFIILAFAVFIKLRSRKQYTHKKLVSCLFPLPSCWQPLLMCKTDSLEVLLVV